jgi:hypothetical protein
VVEARGEQQSELDGDEEDVDLTELRLREPELEADPLLDDLAAARKRH